MWPVSTVFLEALRNSHVMGTTMDIFTVNSSGTPIRVFKDVPVIDGSVNCSRKSKSRRTLSCEIILEYPNDGYTKLLNAVNTRVQVWKGIDFASTTERVPIGVFRVDSIFQVNKGSLSIEGSSLEIMVEEDRFIAPYLPVYGGSAVEEIKRLIQQSIPRATVINQATNDYKMRKRTPWARERWEAIEDLADAMNAEVFCRADGVFIIQDQPSLAYSPVQWVVDEGPRGVLVELTVSEDRQGVYNAVVASGSSGDTDIPAVSGAAYDLNPASPTYWYGGFGHVPKFYESQFLYSVAQCQAVATQQLAESTALAKTVTFQAMSNPALEPGDVIMVSLLNGTWERHVAQAFTIPLGAGVFSVDTLSEDEATGEDPEDDVGAPGDGTVISEPIDVIEPPLNPATYLSPMIVPQITPALNLGLDVLPSGSLSNIQGFGWDIVTGDIYEAQITDGIDVTIHRYDAKGDYVSKMVCVGAGQSTQIAVERASSTVFIWMNWDQREGNTIVSRSLKRVGYVAGTATASGAQTINTGYDSTTYATPAIDEDNNHLTTYVDTGNGSGVFRVYNLSEIIAGSRIVVGFHQTAVLENAFYKGIAIGGDYVYRVSSVSLNTEAQWTNKTAQPNYIEQWNWKDHALIARNDYKSAPLLSTDARKLATEPAGLDVVKVQGQNVLIGAWKFGDGERGTATERRVRLMAITGTRPIPTGPVETPVLLTRITGVDSNVKVTTKNASYVWLRASSDAAGTTNVIYSSYVAPTVDHPANSALAAGSADLQLTGLNPAIRYYYRVAMVDAAGVTRFDNEPDIGRIRCRPTGAFNFNFNFGSCSNGADAAVFDVINKRNEDLFFHLGDMWYENGTGQDYDNYVRKMNRELSAKFQKALYAQTPMSFAPSDHDFAMNNNQNGSMAPTARTNFNAAFRRFFPRGYDQTEPIGMYHSFMWGRVLFVHLDLRTFGNKYKDANTASKSMLGTVQKAWLKNLISTSTAAAIVMIGDTPWVGGANPGDDAWKGFPLERTEIANYITSRNKNVIYLSGDMHAVAGHDGSGSNAQGVPSFSAAPLNRVSSNKGGSWTVGPYPTSSSSSSKAIQQYGNVHVADTGSSMTFTFTGYSASGTARVSMNVVFDVSSAPLGMSNEPSPPAIPMMADGLSPRRIDEINAAQMPEIEFKDEDDDNDA